MKKYILTIENGGLGDHLFYSTFPFVFKVKYGYDKFYLSKDTIFNSKEVFELVWEKNPYFDGVIDENGQVISVFPMFQNENVYDSLLRNSGHPNGIKNKADIYYSPKYLKHLRDVVLIDPNYISNAGFLRKKDIIKNLKSYDIFPTHRMTYRNRQMAKFDELIEVEAESIYDYINLIYSCKIFISAVSGGAELASVYSQKKIVVYGAGVEDTYIVNKHGLHLYVYCGYKSIILRLNRFLKTKIYIALILLKKAINDKIN